MISVVSPREAAAGAAKLPAVVEDLVPESLGERVAPLLPARPPRRYRFPGRRPVEDRVALAGIVFVLKTGITAARPTGRKPRRVVPSLATSVSEAHAA